jgi:hypothetical protein
MKFGAPEPGEMAGLVVAALVLLIVLVVVFMSMQLYWANSAAQAETFLPRVYPAGFTTGPMPEIDDFRPCYGGLGCGVLGVPP